eukprot:scaffold46524_cov44-Cyclotella_meneghiniana.AAC.6
MGNRTTKKTKAKKKTNASKDDPPGTPLTETLPKEKAKKDDAAKRMSLQDAAADDDDVDDEEIYQDDNDCSIRRYMESIGKGHMSIIEWMQSEHPDLKELSEKKKNARDKVRGKPNSRILAEVSSASADEDNGEVPESVKAGVQCGTPASVNGSVLTSETNEARIERESKTRVDFWRFRFKMLERRMKELESENVELKRKTSRGGDGSKRVLRATEK